MQSHKDKELLLVHQACSSAAAPSWRCCTLGCYPGYPGCCHSHQHSTECIRPGSSFSTRAGREEDHGDEGKGEEEGTAAAGGGEGARKGERKGEGGCPGE